MACNCITGNYDLQLKSYDCRNLLYIDLSDWMTQAGFELPATYDVKITPPGRSAITITLDPSKENVIHAKDLFIERTGDTCFIEDGIYCFEVTSCDKIYKRSRAILCSLECCRDNYVLNASRPDGEDVRELIKLDNLIRGIYTNAELNNSKTAMDLYDAAKRLLRRFNCPCGDRLK